MFNVSRRGWFRGLFGSVVGLVAGRRIAGGPASQASGNLGGPPEPGMSQRNLSASGPSMTYTTYIYDPMEPYFVGPRTTFTYDGEGACELAVGEVTTFTYHAPADRV